MIAASLIPSSFMWVCVCVRVYNFQNPSVHLFNPGSPILHVVEDIGKDERCSSWRSNTGKLLILLLLAWVRRKANLSLHYFPRKKGIGIVTTMGSLQGCGRKPELSSTVARIRRKPKLSSTVARMKGEFQIIFCRYWDTSPAGVETKNGCAGENQQQLTRQIEIDRVSGCTTPRVVRQ
jgi:hypothetical protein